MIVLIGGGGYVGRAFQRRLKQMDMAYTAPTSEELDALDKTALLAYLIKHKAKFLINAAGYTGKPNVDACEENQAECVLLNVILPEVIAEACHEAGIPWGHVSSGCIYEGRKPNGKGWAECDAPNFTGSFYSRTKTEGERVLAGVPNVYIWRLRIPFDSVASPRNYLSKLMAYPRLLEAENSISHIGDFAKACLDCWTIRADYGIYNLTNHGSITTRQVVGMIQNYGVADKRFDFYRDEAEFMDNAAIARRSNCVLSTQKAANAGIRIRHVIEALAYALQSWSAVSPISLDITPSNTDNSYL